MKLFDLRDRLAFHVLYHAEGMSTDVMHIETLSAEDEPKARDRKGMKVETEESHDVLLAVWRVSASM